MKIVIHCGASYAFFFRDVVRLAREQHPDVEWHLITLSWRHSEAVKSYLANENIFYAQPAVNDAFEKGFNHEQLSGYAGSIYESIATDKAEIGQLRRKDRAYQLRNAVAYYLVFKNYLQKIKPDVVFIPVVETHESMIIHKVARELGIQVFTHASARNLGISFFSEFPNEDLPPHVFRETPSDTHIRTAEKFVEAFQANPVPAIPLKPEPTQSELLVYPRRLPMTNNFFRRFPLAIINLVKDLKMEPHSTRINAVWYLLLIQFSKVRRFVVKIKGQLNRTSFDVHRMDQLPNKFIYLPLQVTPESSINAFAPYFVDQERVIDLILFHMPSDYQLVIKEHPAMSGVRPRSFYRALRRKAGTLLVDSRLPSIELIKKSALTVSVTGTAAFEALLLGKPSLVVGRTFFSPWVASFDSFSQLRDLIQKAIHEDLQAVNQRAIACLTKIFQCGYDFVLRDPYDQVNYPQHTMNKGNLQRFLDGFFDYLGRAEYSKYGPQPDPTTKPAQIGERAI